MRYSYPLCTHWRSIAITIVFFQLVCFTALSRAETWNIIPSGTAANLRTVAMNSSKIIYVGGERGTLLKSSNGGTSWNIVHYTGIAATILSLIADDSTFAYATADDRVMMYNYSGNGNWPATIPLTDTMFANATTRERKDTSYWDDAHAFHHKYSTFKYWAAGSRGAVTRFTFVLHQVAASPGNVTTSEDFSETNDDAQTPTQSALRAMVARIAVYAVGDDGTLVITRNKGVTWQATTIDPSVSFTGLVSPDSGRLIAIGNGGNIWQSRTDGVTWQNISPAGLTENLNAISFLDSSNGVIVGDHGTILQTTDAGVTWVQQAVKTIHNLHGVRVYTGAGGPLWWVVGDSGTIVETAIGQSTVTYTIDTDTLNFGNVTLGAKPSQTLTFTNQFSEGELTIRAVSSDPSVKLSTSSLLVEPATTGTIKVTYAPTDTVDRILYLVIHHDAGWIPDTVKIFGRGKKPTQPMSSLSRRTIDFGFGDSIKHEPLTIFNTGTGALVISSITFSDTVYFGAVVSLPLTIQPADSAHITVDLKRPVPNDVSAIMVLKGNSTGGNDTVTLSTTWIDVGVNDGRLTPGNFSIAVYPNPRLHRGDVSAHIVAPAGTEVFLRLCDENGGMVSEQRCLVNGEADVAVHTARLPRGMYVYSMSNRAGTILGSAKIAIP